jgi:hypothetical protein
MAGEIKGCALKAKDVASIARTRPGQTDRKQT